VPRAGADATRGGPASAGPDGRADSRPAIEATGLGRDYGTVVALRTLDLTVPRGAMIGVLGPNGAGKTTAMLLLATLLSPSRGSARVFGHDLTRDRAAIRRRLGLVFQETTVDGLLTTRENLRFAAGLMGLSGDRARAAVDDTLTRTGLAPQASRPARQLSGGWRRLADIARATVHRPDLLILDEPTVGLDPEHRDRMWSLLDAERRTRGVTILFSTHYLAEAEPCDRVIMLARGVVVAADAPAALMATVGDEVLEVDGPDAPLVERALEQAGVLRTAVRTERGLRLGVAGRRGTVAELLTAAPRVSRLDVRRATLEDVYFARTKVVLPAAAGVPA
jgi:ABC-2 type transport system ATP-binding protein